jgi:hypothetical protein
MMTSGLGLNGQVLTSYHRSPIDFLFIQPESAFEPELGPDGPLQISAGLFPALPPIEQELSRLRNENAELRRKNLILETKLSAIK